MCCCCQHDIHYTSILYILVVVLYSIVVLYGPKEAVGLEVIYTLDHDVHPR